MRSDSNNYCWTQTRVRNPALDKTVWGSIISSSGAINVYCCRFWMIYLSTNTYCCSLAVTYFYIDINVMNTHTHTILFGQCVCYRSDMSTNICVAALRREYMEKSM